MKNPNKSEVTRLRLRPLLKGLLREAVKLRGVGSVSELIRLLLINEFIRLGLMPSMTDDEKGTEARR
jgi:hypothetical protein